MTNLPSFIEIAKELGELIEMKNEAYGDSFARSEQILKVLYPDGVRPEQYTDFLGVIRVIDKLFRLANKKDAFGESPWGDISGYGILGINNDNIRKATLELEEEERGME